MPFDRPGLNVLMSRAIADIESRLVGADASLRRTLLGILAKMQAGSVHGLYGYLDYIALQGMPDTATDEYLERWASIWGKQRKVALKSVGTVIFSGTDDSVIPLGTLLKRADGFEYETTVEGVIVEGTVEVAIKAIKAGASFNASAGTQLKLPKPEPGIQSAAISSELGGGVDTESNESLLGRYLSRIRQAPQIGRAHV